MQISGKHIGIFLAILMVLFSIGDVDGLPWTINLLLAGAAIAIVVIVHREGKTKLTD